MVFRSLSFSVFFTSSASLLSFVLVVAFCASAFHAGFAPVLNACAAFRSWGLFSKGFCVVLREMVAPWPLVLALPSPPSPFSFSPTPTPAAAVLTINNQCQILKIPPHRATTTYQRRAMNTRILAIDFPLSPSSFFSSLHRASLCAEKERRLERSRSATKQTGGRGGRRRSR